MFKKHGYNVISTDLVVRNDEVKQEDFLKKLDGEHKLFNGTIITNPPYKYALEFVESAMEKIADGNKVCMFLKIQFLEGKKRKSLFEKYPPKTIWVSSSRIMCAKNGDFETMIEGGGSAVSYLFMIFKPHNKNLPTIDWI